MKEKFSADEWLMITQLPAMMIHLVVMAEGRMGSEEEREMALDWVGNPGGISNTLHREIVTWFAEALESNIKRSFGLLEHADTAFAACRSVLQANLTGKEYQEFIASLIFSVVQVAVADGDHPQEKKLVQMLVTHFGLEEDAFHAAVANYSSWSSTTESIRKGRRSPRRLLASQVRIRGRR